MRAWSGARSCPGRQQVAIKAIDKRFLYSEQERAAVQREVESHLLMTHPNVARLYEVYETEQHLLLVLERAALSTLADLTRTRRLPFAEREACWLVYQLLQAVAHMHSKGVLHADVKPENMLLHPMPGVPLPTSEPPTPTTVDGGSEQCPVGGGEAALGAAGGTEEVDDLCWLRPLGAQGLVGSVSASNLAALSLAAASASASAVGGGAGGAASAASATSAPSPAPPVVVAKPTRGSQRTAVANRLGPMALRLILCDFGLARKVPDIRYFRVTRSIHKVPFEHVRGTPGYIAPGACVRGWVQGGREAGGVGC